MLEREIKILRQVEMAFDEIGMDYESITVEGNIVTVTGSPSGSWAKFQFSPNGGVRVTAHR
jgi:hypothetical protein